MTRVCLIGAGGIARVHAEALQALRGMSVVAVVDPRPGAADDLVRRIPGAAAFPSAEAALAERGFDAAHILTPPGTHADLAMPLLQAGKDVLVEKPMATSGADCARLADAAAATGARLGVNQNFLFHPSFAALRRSLAAGELGRPRFIDCVYSVPLRQLSAGQFGHWMFEQPVNILLEQAVHPLSQIRALSGSLVSVAAVPGPARILWEGRRFRPAFTVALGGDRLDAQLRFAVGQTYPLWQISVVCDDGVAVADILANRFYKLGRTRWAEAIDGVLSATMSGAGMLGASVANAGRYGLSLLGLGGRSDAFYRSMRDSIAAFHSDRGRAFEADAAFGTQLVQACEQIAASLPQEEEAPPLPAPATLQDRPDVAVLGGTGFIGRATVTRLLEEGLKVTVMARSVRGLPPVFSGPQLRLARGDIANPGEVAQAIEGAGQVVNLAHGGGGADYAAIRAAMVGGAEVVARACQAQGVARLIHVGSIASLYLGPDEATVTGATPPDPQAERRGDYARAKAECDRMLLGLHATEGLPVCILRPGLVVGAGTSPFHSGLGFFNNEQHCIGWNRGRNPLPFVLVEDVAEAILAALRAPGIEGRSYNLVGGVRPSARDYIAQLGAALGRPLRFHPKVPDILLAEEIAKWVIKRLGGRRVPPPSRRDIISRGLGATFDCGDAERDLGWKSESDPAVFATRAIAVHVP